MTNDIRVGVLRVPNYVVDTRIIVSVVLEVFCMNTVIGREKAQINGFHTVQKPSSDRGNRTAYNNNYDSN